MGKNHESLQEPRLWECPPAHLKKSPTFQAILSQHLDEVKVVEAQQHDQLVFCFTVIISILIKQVTRSQQWPYPVTIQPIRITKSNSYVPARQEQPQLGARCLAHRTHTQQVRTQKCSIHTRSRSGSMT